MVLVGMSQGHSSVLMAELKPSTNSSYSMKIENGEIFDRSNITIESSDTRSWIVALLILFMCPGGWILTVFNRSLGRKQLFTISLALYFVSWMIIAFANDTMFVLIGRAFSGFTSGILVGLIPVYQGECSVPKLRPTFIAIMSAFYSFGLGLSHGLSIWFHWRTIAFFGGLTSVLTLCLSYCTLMESPIWLLEKKKFSQAIRSWSFWRGLQDIGELKSMHGKKSSKLRAGENNFCEPSFLKPLGIIMTFFTVTQMSGAGAVTHYCIQMITEIAGPKRAYIPTMILDTFRLVSSIISSLLTKRYSPRAISLYSAFSVSFFLLSLSVSLLFDIWSPWFSLVLLFAYEASVIMGLMSLPWVFCGELFTMDHKEIGIGIVTTYNYIFYFAVLKFNPVLDEKFQQWGTFLFYGFFTTIGSIILYFILPNTRNKSLKDIELMFYND